MSVADLAPAAAPPESAAPPRRLADKAWRLTAAAGLIQLGGLAAALSGGSALVAAPLAAAGLLLGVAILVPRMIGAVRRNRGLIGYPLLLLVAAAWMVAMVSRLQAWNPGPPPGQQYGPFDRALVPSISGRLPLLVAGVLTASAGLVLLSDAVRLWLGFAPHQRAPWKEMTEAERSSGGIAWRGLVGLVLVGFAALLGIGITSHYVAGHTGREAVALLVLVAAGAAMVVTPIAIGSLMRVGRDKAGSARERERQRFAAHLHDSVLQTLALVQRQAHDPAAVARLARRQEHALRAWMAGESELVSDTVVAALRDVVATVEDDYDVTVELTAVGDLPLDAAGEEVVAAAREALRNAARHARGAAIFVFVATAADSLEVYVRDEGPGFDPEAVPMERRGIRDAIFGRMAFAGGIATLESTPGQGTEVALRLRTGRAR